MEGLNSLHASGTKVEESKKTTVTPALAEVGLKLSKQVFQSKEFCVKRELWSASESLPRGPNLVSEVKGFPKEVTFRLNPE